MSNIVYPNIGAVTSDNEAKVETFIPHPMPQIVLTTKTDADQNKQEQPNLDAVNSWAKRLKVTAWILIVLGGLSALNCLWLVFHARHVAEMILTGDFHKRGGPQPPHPPHPLPDNMTRDEFIVVDVVRTVSFLGVIASIIIACTGKKALYAVWKQKPDFVKKVFKRSLIRFFVVFLLAAYMRHSSQEAKRAVEHFRRAHNITMPKDEMVMLEEPKPHHGKHHGDHRRGRGLAQVEEAKPHMNADFWLKTDQDDCAKLKDENTCNAAAKCSWCKSAAVRSSCNSLENAKALPPAVFACSKLSEEKPVEEKPHMLANFWVQDDRDDCEKVPAKDTCTGNSKCTWCVSNGQRDFCTSIEYA